MKRQLALFISTLTLVGTGAAGIGPLGLGQTASAHMIETNYNLLDQALEFTSTFSTGEPVPEADVSIYAPNNLEEPWLELTTDENGRFSFTPDQSIPGEWEIHIEKGIGHQDFWTVPVNATGIDFDNIVMDADNHSTVANQNNWAAVATIIGLGVAAGVVTYRRRC
ncbi:MAG: carboxypeptidase regulatory-like domain-containing protein [Leptolyngbyaceae bacterium]|nr:carboxypeptidase regulatory-like domain-containing protein [Leptolyngbyaceae bacterium]